jgi:hypothetical protein
MKPEIRTLRILSVIIVAFIMVSCAGAFMSCEVPSPSPNPLDAEYKEFETLCKDLCEPHPSHIIGRTLPGRLSADSKCLCASNPPRIAAKWR